MPFDENLVLHDGTTITADISPTSLTRTNGSAVIDLGKTKVSGLYASLFTGEAMAEADDTMQVTIEESAAVASGWQEIARFPLVTAAQRERSLSFITSLQYIRAKIDITDDDSGGDFSLANVFINLGTVPTNDVSQA